ncbi:hypothetical protein SYNPS1DRAFT_27306 [Syncephalis pseudoplumigaleata]|uniref:Uncharacterized protein n=1 Tax=Syncephalis pseudoplumigaleata TaxID=1712513 RepID=A0A4P9Z5F9_9FUNG|nr:hypothetical protein SYNPS1DRAFT_27306 [Syncephalis pseudoplumigaleata]|eukprot:RKP27031.1 hypothetical protein SYNPS1DRAFT_27306 [Syncephalis pseudoplumigaleata]
MVDNEHWPISFDVAEYETEPEPATAASSVGRTLAYSLENFFCSKHLDLKSAPQITYKLKMTIAHKARTYCVIGFDDHVKALLNVSAEALHHFYRNEPAWRIVDIAPIDASLPCASIIDRVASTLLPRSTKQSSDDDDDDDGAIVQAYQPSTHFKFVACKIHA